MPVTVTADGIGRTRLDPDAARRVAELRRAAAAQFGFGRWGEVFATTPSTP